MNQMGDNGYALDLLSPIRHVATEMDGAAPAALSIEEMAVTYRHPNPADFARVRMHEGCATDDEATIWLIRQAVAALRQRGKSGKAQIVGDARSGYRFAEGITFEDLRYDRKKLERERDDHTRLGDPFNPMSGVFSENIRRGKQQPSKQADDELRESMRGGWLPGHPAIIDERGVVIVGHRRLAMAEELGIDKKAETIRFGDGDAGDIERLRLALQSNLGTKPFSPSDRAEVAKYLTERGWTQASIGEALHVAQATISNDLRSRGVIKPDNATDSLGRRNTGRSRGPSPQRVVVPEMEVEIAQFVEADEPVPTTELAAKYGVRKGTVDARVSEERARAEERQRLQREEIPSVPEHACPRCGAMHPMTDS